MAFFKSIKGSKTVESDYNYDSNDTLAKTALTDGGDIYPLIIPSEFTGGTGLMNPSILNLDGKLIVNIRHTNYTLYHSEKKTNPHPWGPLSYLHPEDDIHLRTDNFYCELNSDFEITRFNKVDTTKLDKEPIWEFVGLEDARLVYWDDKLFMTGVRRDTNTTGQGRMELSEIEVTENSVVEVARHRIASTGDDTSYCEKNWMPVLDQPFTYMKWCNPVEVVKVNKNYKAETIHIGSDVLFGNDERGLTEPRGDSQVIKYGDYYLALTHACDLFKSELGRKDGVYRHMFILWDKDWNIVKCSKDFSIMNSHIEFSCGMCEYDNHILITFGLSDNAAYILKIPHKTIDKYLEL